jgi:lipoate-protein ligase A
LITLIQTPLENSPFFYAALEEWLVRSCDCSKTDYLLLYVNDDCVVVGRNQCVYQEVHFNFWFNLPGKVVRRVSGGGTVFHDSGNLNFCFVSAFEEKKVNNYAYFNEPIRSFLLQKNVPAVFNHRNDILVNGKKISGSAQFTDRKNILSHGTLLVHSNLQKLSDALKENAFVVHTKAVSSVKSSVANISEFNPELCHIEHVRKELAQRLCADVFTLSERDWERVKHLQSQKYETYDWKMGRSPDAILQGKNFSLYLSKGVIDTVEVNHPDFSFLKKIESHPFEKQTLTHLLTESELNVLMRF